MPHVVLNGRPGHEALESYVAGFEPFVQLAPRETELTVRLEPLTDPEKTPAVRRAIAVVAARVVAASGCAYARTDIDDFLTR